VRVDTSGAMESRDCLDGIGQLIGIAKFEVSVSSAINRSDEGTILNGAALVQFDNEGSYY